MASKASEPPTAELSKPTEIFARARENVLEQLKRSNNYSCTEVVDRIHAYNGAQNDAGCSSHDLKAAIHPYMHDRLRLDVAVSSGGEIFSWHGGKEFSSAGIQSIVKTGAVSSGAFTGYVSNVFGSAGVIIRYVGSVSTSAAATFTFSYEVPLASSKLQVGSKRVLTPFHGSFTVDKKSLQLKSLEVIIDHPPALSDICAASMSIHYQMINISDQPSLVPEVFLLKLNAAQHQSNTSRTEFTDCHAFRGESTIHYLSLDDGEPNKQQISVPQLLPEHVKLHAAVKTRIDDRTSYTGDPVEATLLNNVDVHGTDIYLHKGAILKGVITRLENYYTPTPHYLLSIRLDSIVDGTKSFLIDGVMQTPFSSEQELASLYGLGRGIQTRGLHGRTGETTAAQIHNSAAPDADGELLFVGNKLHTPAGMTATWITKRIGGE